MSDLISTMPSDEAMRNVVVGAVKELVESLVTKAAATDTIKDIKDTLKEDHGVDPAYIMQLATIEYDAQYNSNKKADKIEREGEILDEYLTFIKQ